VNEGMSKRYEVAVSV